MAGTEAKEDKVLTLETKTMVCACGLVSPRGAPPPGATLLPVEFDDSVSSCTGAQLPEASPGGSLDLPMANLQLGADGGRKRSSQIPRLGFCRTSQQMSRIRRC